MFGYEVDTFMFGYFYRQFWRFSRKNKTQMLKKLCPKKQEKNLLFREKCIFEPPKYKTSFD